tara:strand:+ start:306 stop:533 length:228 start_codon:yes stop_codon:yes gene_type:complete
MNWIETKAGLQMAETIIRYMPRITVCLENIARGTGTISVNSNHSRMVIALEKLVDISHNGELMINDPDDGSWVGR